MTKTGSNVVLQPLKVGSCPKSDKSVQLLFFLFCVAFKQFNFLNVFLPRKPQGFAENSPFFVCLFPLCWNSINSVVTCPKWVSSDAIL